MLQNNGDLTYEFQESQESIESTEITQDPYSYYGYLLLLLVFHLDPVTIKFETMLRPKRISDVFPENRLENRLHIGMYNFIFVYLIISRSLASTKNRTRAPPPVHNTPNILCLTFTTYNSAK
jgi:hypothetical protein